MSMMNGARQTVNKYKGKKHGNIGILINS